MEDKIKKLKEFLSPMNNKERGSILTTQLRRLREAGIECIKHSYMDLDKLDAKNCISYEDMGIVWLMEFELISNK